MCRPRPLYFRCLLSNIDLLCKGATIYFTGGGGELLSMLKINMFRLNFCEIINCLKDEN